MDSALSRFLRHCRFDPGTGCVLWMGGTTSGCGTRSTYGAFWYEGRRWAAHRWAGVHIHGLDLDGLQAGHCCPHGPNTLCVEHIVAQTAAENNAEQHGRLGNPRHRPSQTSLDRQYWLLVTRGYEQRAEREMPTPFTDVPFYLPPGWMRGIDRVAATGLTR